MKQSRRMSLVEAVTNVCVGYGLAVLTQVALFPWFGIDVSLAQNMALGGIFTAISIARSYALRRLFEALTGRRPRWHSGSHGDARTPGTEA